MADYIDRQAAIDALLRTAREKFNLSDEFNHYLAGLMDGETAIRQLPSADIQPVVRCKDCKYCDTGIDEDGNHFLKCLGWVYGGTKEDDYCSHGVRKDG